MRCVISCIFAAALWISGCKGGEEPATPPPPQVQVVAIQSQEVTIEKDFVGQVYGYRDIPVSTRVEGIIEQISFKEGGYVKKGDKLYEIERDPLQEGVNKARSELASAQVRLEKAKSDLERIAPLAEINAVSKKDLDAAIAEKGAAQAMVEAAKAGGRLSDIRLGYATVSAPMDGVIGKTRAREGEFVGRAPNSVVLNTVSSIDSVRVEFFLTERDYLNFVNEQGGAPKATEMPLKLLLADGLVFPESGRVDFVNREVDAATGAILISAIFPNPERLIRPGQFARVRVAVRTLPEALLIPQRCVNEVQGNFSAMRVNAEGTVEQVSLGLGPAYRDYFIVKEGLKAGDRVVYEGLQKAGKGSTVEAVEVVFVSQYPVE